MKHPIARVKKFVSKHRVALTFAATSAGWIALILRNAKEWNNFLEKKGLIDEYYYDEEE